jgi:hypothetical protein
MQTITTIIVIIISHLVRREMHPLYAVGERKKFLKSEVAAALFVKLKEIVTQKLLPLEQHRVQVNLKEEIGGTTTTKRIGVRR